MKRFITILCLCFFTAMSAFCADFYVSTAGSDGNPGTQAQPFATIQHAVDISPSGPTTYIHLDASTWTTSVIILDKDISIAGDYNGPHGMGGRDVTHINGGIQAHGTSGNIPALLVSNLSAQWIDHMMQQSGSAPTSSVTNCDISNPAGDGIKGWYINAVSCIVHNCTGNGIILIRDSDASNCTVYNNSGFGISLTSTGYPGNATNNTVYNNGGDGITGNCFPVSVTGNTCHDNSGAGIKMYTSCYDYGSSIHDNQCYNNSSYGIYVGNSGSGASALSINNNDCHENNIGIYCSSLTSNNVISNNIINNNDQYGLQLSYNTTYKVYENSICGNSSYGVYLEVSVQPDLGGGAQSSPGNNTISGNGTYDLYKTGTQNIYVKNNHWDAVTEAQMASGFQKRTNITRFYDAFDYWQPGDPLSGAFIWMSSFPRNGVLDFAASKTNRVQVSSVGQLKAVYAR